MIGGFFAPRLHIRLAAPRHRVETDFRRLQTLIHHHGDQSTNRELLRRRSCMVDFDPRDRDRDDDIRDVEMLWVESLGTTSQPCASLPPWHSGFSRARFPLLDNMASVSAPG